MTIIFRTDGAWGTGLGVNLSPTQVDGNFWDLQGRLTYIEDNPVEPIEPISITISGSQFSMGLSNGETLGPITMTMPVPLWRGNWLPSTFYNEMDYFTAPDGGFGVVIAPHTSATTFDWAATSGGQPVYQVIVGASGTTSALGDLVDVSLGSEADGDLLVFNLATGFWQNRTKAVVATTILPPFGGDSGTGGLRGMVPAPAAGDAAAGKVLGAGGGWIVPATGSGGSTSLAGLIDVSIVSPANLSLLQYQSSDGKWHNQTLATLGAGTVTQVNSGAGLSGGPITTTGTLSLAQIAALNLLANVTGSTAAPSGVTLSQFLDAVLGSVRGSILRRDGTIWSTLAPGTAGQYLKTGGTGADVSWDAPVGSGTVTSIATGAGLAGGPITSTGTLSLAQIADSTVLANVSGSTAAPSGTTPSLLLDHVFGSTQGQILYRGATAWSVLGVGTAGQVLTTGGAAANPSWAAGGGIFIGDTAPASPTTGQGWFDSVGGQLYIRYNDGDSSQWVPASNQTAPGYLPLVGGTISGTAPGTLTVNRNTAAPIAAVNPGVQIIGVDGAAAAYEIVSSSTQQFCGRHYNGPLSAPTGAVNTNILVALQGRGYGASAWSTSRGQVIVNATENWDDTHQGTSVTVQATPTGGISTAVVATFQAGVQIGAPTGGDKGAGTLNGTAIYANNVLLTSDAALKRDIAPLPDNCLALVAGIEPKRFRFIDPGSTPSDDPDIGPTPSGPPGWADKTHWGFVAQDVEHAMRGRDFGGVETDADGLRSLSYNDMIAVLWKAVTELTAKVKELEGRS